MAILKNTIILGDANITGNLNVPNIQISGTATVSSAAITTATISNAYISNTATISTAKITNTNITTATISNAHISNTATISTAKITNTNITTATISNAYISNASIANKLTVQNLDVITSSTASLILGNSYYIPVFTDDNKNKLISSGLIYNNYINGNSINLDETHYINYNLYNGLGLYSNSKSFSDSGKITLNASDNIILYGANGGVQCNGILTVTDKVNATNGFFLTSDIRKKDINGQIDLNTAYEMIDKCQTIIYTLKDNLDKTEIGLIAQEVQKFFPEIISEDVEGFLQIDYSKLTVILMRVLKDVIEQIKLIKK